MEIARFYILWYRQRVSRCKDKYRYVNDRNQWEWYVLVAPNDDNYVIADVKDSVGTKFLEAENNKNERYVMDTWNTNRKITGFL